MSSDRLPPAAPRNRLLALLPEDDYRRLLPLLKPVTLALVRVSRIWRRTASGPGGEFPPGEAHGIRSGTPGFPAQARLSPPG